jgi:hypothetical protein
VTRPELAPRQLADTRPREYAARFLFGGLITLGTGLVAKAWGPAVAGLFLAFPAILPASLTLVKRHDGRRRAIDDARGARLGSLALIAFALVVARAAPALPAALVLVLATIAWLGLDVALW